MTDFVDPYLDPETGILRNFAGATTQEELRKAETDVAGMAELTLDNIPRSNDLAELQAIHRALFGRIYDWAGEIRTVDIKKGSETFFLFAFQISQGAKFVFDELAKEKALKGLPKDKFVERLDAGYFTDWKQVVGDELDKASVEGREHYNLRPLEEMFSRIVSSLPK